MRPTVLESFDRMGLREELLRGIYGCGFDRPSEVQQRVGPMLHGQNLIARAESGTGKTAAFAIGVLQLLDCCRQASQALVLTSGREQAMQIHHVFLALGESLWATCHACIGGTSVRDDIDALWQAPHVVVGTAGRVADMIARGHLETQHVKVLVLDEADALMRGGTRAVRDIRRSLPHRLQLCFFSATLPPDVVSRARELCGGTMRETSEISVGGYMPAALHHFYVSVEREEWKLDTLMDLLDTSMDLCGSPSRAQTVVFCNTLRKVDFLFEQLRKRDFVVGCLHAELDQRERDLVLREFRAGRAFVLVATDLLERGIDVQQVSLVINYDLPPRSDSYLHRAARAGRFHRSGFVISFATDGSGDEAALRDFQRHFQISIQELPMDFMDLL